MTVLEALGQLFLASVIALALLGFCYLALRHSVATVAVLLMVWVSTVALRDAIDLAVVASGIRISVVDVMSVILLAIGVGRMMTVGVRTIARALVLGLIGLLVLHNVRGLGEFGLELSTNDARQWLYFIAAVAYAATAPDGWDERVWKAFVAGGSVVAVIASSYFLTEGTSAATQLVLRGGELVSARPATAAAALLILQSAIIALVFRWPSRGSSPILAVGLALVVLFLQHRTVWVAALLVIIIGFAWWSAVESRENKPLVFGATGALLLLTPLAMLGFLSSGPLLESASEVTGTDSTIVWRTTGWGELISTHDSFSQLAAGDPAGSDWSRTINGQEVSVSSHNGFIDAFVRFGFPGALILVWLLLLLWLRRAKIAEGLNLPLHLVGLLLITQAVFSIAYSLDFLQGLITGILVSGLPVAKPAVIRSDLAPSVAPEYAAP